MARKASLHVVVEGGVRLSFVERQLKQAADHGLRRELRKGLRDAAKPTVRDLKSAVRRVKVTALPPARFPEGHPHRPLRRRVSNNLRLSMRPATGVVRIEVNPKAFPPGSTRNPPTLPKYLDASLKAGRQDFARWRHPVFWPGPIGTAPASRIAMQRGQPWFFVTIDKHRATMRREMFRSIDRVADQITSRT